MTSIGPLQGAMMGIQTGLSNAQKNAEKLASNIGQSSDKLVDTTASLVELKVSERQVQASAKVVKAVDNAMGSLLDITA